MNESESKAPLKTRRTWILGSPVPAVEVLIAVIVLMFCANLWIKHKASTLNNKLQTITIASLDFVDMPLSEAVTFFNEQIHLQQPSLGPDVIQIEKTEPPPPTSHGGFGFGFTGIGGLDPDQKITLKLRNIEFHEAIRYTAMLVQGYHTVGHEHVHLIPSHTRAPSHWIEKPFDWVAYRYLDLKYRYEDWRIRQAIKSGKGIPVDPFL